MEIERTASTRPFVAATAVLVSISVSAVLPHGVAVDGRWTYVFRKVQVHKDQPSVIECIQTTIRDQPPSSSCDEGKSVGRMSTHVITHCCTGNTKGRSDDAVCLDLRYGCEESDGRDGEGTEEHDGDDDFKGDEWMDGESKKREEGRRKSEVEERM